MVSIYFSLTGSVLLHSASIVSLLPTRRDSKRRVLRPGESVRADRKYQYKYHIDGKPRFYAKRAIDNMRELMAEAGIV